MAQNAIAVQYEIITVPVHFGSKNLDIPLAPQQEHPQESRDKGVLDDFFPAGWTQHEERGPPVL